MTGLGTAGPALRRVVLLAVLETRLFLREPVAVFFSFAFPLLLLAFVGSIYGSVRFDNGLRFIDEYFPLMVGVSAANLGVMGLSLHLAETRARGVLRRYKLSPLAPLEFFAAHMLTTVVMLLVALSGLAGLTLVGYGLAEHPRPALFAAATVLTMYAMFSLGVFVGGLPLPARSVQVLGSVLFFFIFFSSGAAIPRQEFPDWLRRVSEANPLTHLNELLVAGYTGQGTVSPLPLVAVLVATAALNLLTRRTFDWEGRP